MNSQIPTRRPTQQQRSGAPSQRPSVPSASAPSRGRGAMAVVLAVTVILLVISLVLLGVALFVDLSGDEPEPITPTAPSGNENDTPTPGNNKKPSYATVPSRSDYLIPNSASYQTVSGINSRHTILLDMDSYEAVAGLNPDTRICPASMTKVMTLLVACENLTSLTDKTTVSAKNVSYRENDLDGASGLSWKGGEVLSVEDLLYLIYFRSDTVACLTMADYISGGEAAFVELMNAKAKKLGLKDTHFTNTTGLLIEGEDYYTTCREMAMIMAYAMDNPLAKKVMMQTGAWYLPKGSPVEYIRPTWMTERFGGNGSLETVTIKAAKTGWETEPGYCLVSYAEGKNGKSYINVIVANSVIKKEQSTSDVKAIYKTYAK